MGFCFLLLGTRFFTSDFLRLASEEGIDGESSPTINEDIWNVTYYTMPHPEGVSLIPLKEVPVETMVMFNGYATGYYMKEIYTNITRFDEELEINIFEMYVNFTQTYGSINTQWYFVTDTIRYEAKCFFGWIGLGISLALVVAGFITTVFVVIFEPACICFWCCVPYSRRGLGTSPPSAAQTTIHTEETPEEIERREIERQRREESSAGDVPPPLPPPPPPPPPPPQLPIPPPPPRPDTLPISLPDETQNTEYDNEINPYAEDEEAPIRTWD